MTTDTTPSVSDLFERAWSLHKPDVGRTVAAAKTFMHDNGYDWCEGETRIVDGELLITKWTFYGPS